MRHPLSFFRSFWKAFRPIQSVSSALLLFTCLMFWNTQAFADEQARAVRLSYVQGAVQIMFGDQTQFQQAYANMPLPEGSRLQTGNDGRAELQMEDGSIARLTPNSSLLLSQLRTDSSGQRISEIEFLSGLGYFELQPQSNTSQSSIVYQQNRIVASSLAVFRINADNPPGDLEVLSGDLHLAGAGDFSVDAHANEQVRFDSGNGSGYYLAQGVSEESWDQWNSDRDNTLNKEAEQQTAATASAEDRNNPAWNDLDAYGNWYDVDGYGQVWSPYGAGSNWDPYGYGYWAWYPGSGYQWVSRYNWGYLPYRCGAWNYFNDFGWGWIPGGCGGNYLGGSIVVWNTPPGYNLPLKPITGHPPRPLPITARIVPVDRGGPVRYRPQPIYGVGGVSRPVTIAGRPAQPLPPIRLGNGFTSHSGDGSPIVIGQSGLPRPDHPVRITPVEPQGGGGSWSIVSPQPSHGLRPGQDNGQPRGVSPVQPPRPVISAPRPIIMQPSPRSPSELVAPPQHITPIQPSAPRMMPAPAPSVPYMAPMPSTPHIQSAPIQHSAPPPAGRPGK